MLINASSTTLQSLQAATALSDPTAVQSAAMEIGETPSPGVAVDVSKPGQLMSQLADLAKSDPTKFKAVTAQIAEKLRAAAATAGGQEGAALGKLADRFDAASQSGNASDLAPSQARGHHHHHHHGGGSYDKSGSAAPDGDAAGGGTGSDSIAQTVQGIISGALQSASTPAS